MTLSFSDRKQLPDSFIKLSHEREFVSLDFEHKRGPGALCLLGPLGPDLGQWKGSPALHLGPISPLPSDIAYRCLRLANKAAYFSTLDASYAPFLADIYHKKGLDLFAQTRDLFPN